MKILTKLVICITVCSIAANGQLYYNNCGPEGDCPGPSRHVAKSLNPSAAWAI